MEIIENKNVVIYWLNEMLHFSNNGSNINYYSTYPQSECLWIILHGISATTFAYSLKNNDMTLINVLSPALARTASYALKQASYYLYKEQVKNSIINKDSKTIKDYTYKYSFYIASDAIHYKLFLLKHIIIFHNISYATNFIKR